MIVLEFRSCPSNLSLDRVLGRQLYVGTWRLYIDRHSGSSKAPASDPIHSRASIRMEPPCCLENIRFHILGSAPLRDSVALSERRTGFVWSELPELTAFRVVQFPSFPPRDPPERAKGFESATRFSRVIRALFRIGVSDWLHIFRPRGDIISSDYRFAVFGREPSSLAFSIRPPPGEITDGCTDEADVGRRRGVRPPRLRSPRLGNRPDWGSRKISGCGSRLC